MPIALAVHGGAWNIPDAAVAPSRTGVERALELGWRRLLAGETALDVVECVVRDLEDDPTFDAGRGSRLNSMGGVELDASIMDGRTLAAGAVAAIENVRHPISVARAVMERSVHVLLAGAGARRFAESVGAELCATEDLLVGRELERYRRVRGGEHHLVDEEFRGSGAEPPHGTVGAVAIDRDDHLAAATSTGGTQNKLPGRVGDTAIIGAGTYADDNQGAASATGWGEGILRAVLCKAAIDELAIGRHPREAAALALARLTRVRGTGGLIVVDRRGRAGWAMNTPRMARGVAAECGLWRVEIEPDPAGRAPA